MPRPFHTILLGVMSLLFASPICAADKAAAANSIGTTIADFTLRDARGKAVSLADHKDAKLIVVAFFGTECPLVNQYARPLDEIAKKFAKRGVTTLIVNSNVQDSITELAAWEKKHGLSVAVLKDAGNAVADQFKAARTPEVFVLDASRVVRYRGRIDDQYGIGYQRPAATEQYLETALDELLAGKEVTTKQTDVEGCTIGRVRKADETSDVTYSKQISRIFALRCVECHRPGEIAPFPLTSYEEAHGWAEMIDEVVQDQRMPPWHANPAHGRFANDARLSDEEKQLIHRWVVAGAPEGNKADLSEPKKYSEGWRIPTPDLVVNVTAKPFKVRAKGEVEYQYFEVDPGFTEDKWIKAAECRPGNRAVVHHIIAFIRPPDAGDPDDEHPAGRPRRPSGTIENDWLIAYAPGARAMDLPTGLAKFVPKGSKFVFQVHYTPNGTEQLDQSTMGLVFTDGRKVRKEVGTWRAANPRFKIPPGAASHEVKAQHIFNKDAILMAMFPHMHLRGKAFKYEAVYPDGKREILLDVPNYDFGWQNSYVFAEPKRMPAGTRLLCTAQFDNSAANLNNPDPKASVRWGDQTWEEMMIGYFSMVLADQDLTRFPKGTKRVDEFKKRLADGEKIAFSEELSSKAKGALAKPESLVQFAAALEKIVPQLDRVDLSTVSGGKLHMRQASETPESARRVGIGQISIPAAGLALTEYAERKEPTAHGDLSKEKSPDLQFAARMMSSSVHVPVTINGEKGTINFWSMETEAFPEEAIKILTEAAAALAK